MKRQCHRRTGGIPGVLALVALSVAGLPDIVLANAEDGGSGLVRIDQAYSLPAGRPVFGLWTSVFSRTDSDAPRLFRITPSATFGVATGFEASGSLLFEGTEQEGEGDYDRQIDIRRRDLVAKLRWSGPLATTSFRIGAEGVLGVGLGSSERPGGTDSPDRGIDPGLVGMVSTNVGAFRFPVRVHGNVGYWWSRDDGAFYYRDFPTAVPIPGAENADHNDVFSAGVGVEAGIRHLMLLAELTTEQFQGARAEIAGEENLWMLTAGVRGRLTDTIGITGAITFDVSDDDDRTQFRPSDVFPDTQLRVGLTFGAVASRDRYEERRRAEAEARRREQEEARRAESPPAEADTSMAAGTWEPVPEPPKSSPEPPKPSPESPVAPEAMEARIRDLEMRLRQVELENRLFEIERRVMQLGPGGAPPVAGPAPSPSPPAAPSTPATPPPPTAAPGSTAVVPPTARSMSDQSGETSTGFVDLETDSEPAPEEAEAPRVTEPVPFGDGAGDLRAPPPEDVQVSIPEAAPSVSVPTTPAPAVTEVLESASAEGLAGEGSTMPPPSAPGPGAVGAVGAVGPSAIPGLTSAIPTPGSPATKSEESQRSSQGPSLPFGVTLPPVSLGGGGRSQGSVTIVETSDAGATVGSPKATPSGFAPPGAGATMPLDELILEYRRAKEGMLRKEAPETPGPASQVPAGVGAPEGESPEVAAATGMPDAEAPPAPTVLPAPGVSRTLEGLDLNAPNPVAQPRSRAILETLAAELVSLPEAVVRITVFGPPGDEATVRLRTAGQAEAIRAYLVVAGARPDQGQVEGAGPSPLGAHVEIARIDPMPE